MTSAATDDDDGETVVIQEIHTRKGSAKDKEDPNSPVENDEPIPLFPNYDKNPQHVIVAIRVYKRDPPGDGYKGEVPPTTSLDFIGRRWGNGIFDFEAINSKSKVLRRESGKKVSFAPLDDGRKPMPIDPTPQLAERLLERQASQHERDAARAQTLSESAITQSRDSATQYATMVREDSKQRIERDREYFTGLANQQQTFFQAMFMQMQQMHQHSLEQARESNRQTIQMMEAAHSRQQDMNNPMLLISLFERGMKLGQDTGIEGEDPLSVAMKAGVGGLGHLAEMMRLQKAITPAKLPASTNPAKAPKTAKTGEKREPPLTRDELRELVKLKRTVESKGYDFQSMIEQAKASIGGEPEEDEEGDDDATGGDSERAGPASVEGGESSD